MRRIEASLDLYADLRDFGFIVAVDRRFLVSYQRLLRNNKGMQMEDYTLDMPTEVRMHAVIRGVD